MASVADKHLITQGMARMADVPNTTRAELPPNLPPEKLHVRMDQAPTQAELDAMADSDEIERLAWCIVIHGAPIEYVNPHYDDGGIPLWIKAIALHRYQMPEPRRVERWKHLGGTATALSHHVGSIHDVGMSMHRLNRAWYLRRSGRDPVYGCFSHERGAA